MKKGAFDLGRKALYMIVVVLILTVVFLYMRHMVLSYTSEVVSNVDRVEKEVIVQKMLFSPECLAYKDTESGRVYPGTIVLGKVSDNLGKNCLKFIKRPVKLRVLMGKTSGGSYSGFEGTDVERRSVIVRDGKKVYNGILEVSIGKET
jgi:hypothetical protein